MSTRLVAVLGYSEGRSENLHAVCRARLVRGQHEAGPGDIVLLSGWARGRDATSEAELMARSWRGRAGRILLDRRARTTFGNARGIAELARSSGVRHVVLVTSGWHARRATVLLRVALRGSGTTVSVAATADRGTFRTRLRELGCWTAVAPLAALTARKR